ncbi:Replication factor C subunit [Spraguea lophii 42_110]|uniref:Replication factor C subunit n=1 Tax=Spraguea lophii (strain 42_110) TaxID=1358809 RepID=S7XIB0_SPRLO|nr:Replication factor C subunit [Spraguea lophii 42_110]
MSLPFVEKYRPKSLDELIGHEAIISILSNSLTNLPNLLFYGPPGTGKTTTIRIIFKLLNLPPNSILELNASDDRGIDVVRDRIKIYSSIKSETKKILVLDEVDSMSNDAQNALRRIIEDYSNNVTFCLIANYSNKIIPAIQSRCSKFRFKPVKNVKNKIIEITTKENIKITEEAIDILNDNNDGDIRKLINDIEGMSKMFDIIDKNNIHKFYREMDSSEIKKIYFLLTNNNCDVDSAKQLIDNARKQSLIDGETLIRKLGEEVKNGQLENKMKILKEMSVIEQRLGVGCSQDVQINTLLHIFKLYN